MKNTIICLVLMAAITSCSSIKVSTDFAKEAPFASYKTFNFSPHADSLPVNQINKDRVFGAIVTELTAKGLTKSDSPDLWVDINIMVEKKQTATATTSGNGGYYGGGYRGGYGGYGGGFSTTTIDYDTYLDGTLFFDLIDASKNQLVWQGRVTGTINEEASAAKREKNINYGVKQVFGLYPPVIK